ncbi:hypothetical protein PPN31114_03109 [Pandoraea pneumonica]|uniref:Uncharacterized protein n=2 Tax=Pandoraea pneumonica TaxID=2508299 RepID=A0A5E4WAQ1_9BURK|nr:hypothetical protein PPN31114_03109 [Pandoraea pneumonica]
MNYLVAEIPHFVLQLTVLMLFGFSAASFVMAYLQTGFVTSELIHLSSDHLKAQQLKENSLRYPQASVLGSSPNGLEGASSSPKIISIHDERDWQYLVECLKDKIKKEASDSLIGEFKGRIEFNQKHEAKTQELSARFAESRARIVKELASLGRRGNVNLTAGGVITVIGLALLATTVLQEVAISRSTWEFAAHFLPRMTLVVMIELFAFFFLSLYKSSLQEIKYFQNELTNLESKQIALRTAIDFGSQNLISNTVSAIAATERNHVLSKDQTTVELEKAKIEREGRGDLAKYLAEILQKRSQ